MLYYLLGSGVVQALAAYAALSALALWGAGARGWLGRAVAAAALGALAVMLFADFVGYPPGEVLDGRFGDALRAAAGR